MPFRKPHPRRHFFERVGSLARGSLAHSAHAADAPPGDTAHGGGGATLDTVFTMLSPPVREREGLTLAIDQATRVNLELTRALSMAFTDGKLFFSTDYPKLYLEKPERRALRWSAKWITLPQMVAELIIVSEITSLPPVAERPSGWPSPDPDTARPEK